MPDDIEFLGNKGDDDFFTWVYDPNATGKDAVTPEDLFVWVSFRALPKSRSVIETDGTYSSTFFDTEGIQFVSSTEQNGNEYVTTNYTNVGGSQTSNKEAFGIQSIDMTYGASLAPKVRITFVDLRGAGLFNGFEFDDEKGMKYNSSEFSAFFRLPYPLFELSVKGFYGKAMTYCLHMVKCSARFDESVGNFVMDAEFIGYTFAFLTDIILKYVKAITSTEIGASALAKQNKKRLKLYPNSNEIIPMDDFLMNLGKLTRIAEDLKDNSGEYEELLVVNTIIQILDKLIKTIGKPVGENVSSIYGSTLPFPQLVVNQDQVFIRDVGVISEGSSQIHDIIVEDLVKFVKKYNELIKKEQSEYAYLSKYKLQNFDIKTPALAQPINDSLVNEVNTKVLGDGLSQKNQTITVDTLLSRFSLQANSTRNFYVIDYHAFRKEVSDLLSDALEKQAELQRIINEKLNKKLGQELGFDLKIESILNIILGNVEAFIDVIYNVALEADNPNLQAERIGRLSNIRTDINVEDQRIYPFPAVFDSDTGTEVWIGDIVGENNPAFPEIRLVKETINALVGVNTKASNDRVRNNTRRSINPMADGWIPVSPADYEENSLQNIDNLSFNGNQVPEELANTIVTRALFAYEATGFNDERFNIIAQTEGSYASSQVQNNVIKQVIKNFDNIEFVDQVIEKSGFPSKNNITELSNFDFLEGEGVLIGGFNDDSAEIIEEIIGQPKRVLPENLVNTINTFKKSLDDTLITTKNKDFHRKLDSNGLYVYGDASDYGWEKKVIKNLRKFYKNRTSNDLDRKTPLNSTAIEVVNDLTIFDGQINNNVDFSKSNNKDSKFTNNARDVIGNNLVGGGDKGECIFDTQYYQQSSDLSKVYYFLLTIPIDNLKEFYNIFKLGGIYKFSRIQFAWFASQFYRAKYINDNGFDIFDKTIEDVGLSLVLGKINFNLFKTEFEDVRDSTIKFLPNLADFTEEFVDTMVFYYEQWMEQFYKANEKLEFHTQLYCQLTSNGINVSSSEYKDYKKEYNYVLTEFIESIDFMMVNPQTVLNPKGKLYKSLGVKILSEGVLRAHVNKWIETFKKTVTIENNNNKSIGAPLTTLTEEQQFYIEDKDFKLATYRHFKNLYDKWIGGSRSEQLHNVCTYGGGGQPRDSMLIDRFHFIDRTWSHIGDRAVLNPTPIMQLLESPDISLYEYIGNIFRDSNFDFHVLPSWVNYKNLREVREMWKPQTDVDNASSGAAYICMYMGGRSKVLDIGKKVGYVNDGFDLRSFDTEIPKGFKDRRTPEYVNDLEDNEKFKYNMVVFRVSYADQNQSIFKGISVSQEEHRETAESLQALSDAFDNRGGTKRLYKGVNLYNVFALRSYKCTVKSMGNMMIHPLCYFQLDNVPLFHGAYLITKVSHSITPHYIETTFEGARVPKYVVPIVEFPTTYVNIPLSDTLFKPDLLDDSIVRSLTPEDPESFVSDGENTSFREVGEGIPTTGEILEAQDEDNVLFQDNFVNTKQVFNFFIKPDLTEEILQERIAKIYNPNAPITFKGVGLGDCYGWTKRSLNTLGVLQDPYYGIDAWTSYSGWDDNGTVHITDEQFTKNLQNGWTNASMAEVIPDGSLIACYYPSSEYMFRSIDRMVTTGISKSKVTNLNRLLQLDNIPNRKASKYYKYSDTTPINRLKYNLKAYRLGWTEKQISDYARSIDGKILPIAPVTHSAVFINGHCFHQIQRVESRPTRTMRIVAYYPFKDKLIKKI